MPGLWRVADGEFCANCYKIDIGEGILSERVPAIPTSTISTQCEHGFEDFDEGYKSWVLRGKGHISDGSYLLGYDSSIKTDQFCIDLRSARLIKQWPLVEDTLMGDCSSRFDYGTPTLKVAARGLVTGIPFHDETTTAIGPLTIECGGPKGQRISGNAVYTMVQTKQTQNRGQAIRATVDATYRSNITFLNRKLDVMNSDPTGTSSVMVGVPGRRTGQRLSGAAIIQRLTLDISRVTGSKVPVGFTIVFDSDPTP